MRSKKHDAESQHALGSELDSWCAHGGDRAEVAEHDTDHERRNEGRHGVESFVYLEANERDEQCECETGQDCQRPTGHVHWSIVE